MMTKNKLLTKLILLTVMLVGGASGVWGQTELFSTNFKEWETQTVSAGSSVNDLFFKATTTVTKTQGLTPSGNASKSSNYYAVILSNVNSSLTITIEHTSMRPQFNYGIVEYDALPTSISDMSSDMSSTTRASSNSTSTSFTVNNISKSYVIIYFGKGSNSSNIIFTGLTITTPESTAATSPSITTQPVGATYEQGATATALSVVATASTGSLSYQWYSNSTNTATIDDNHKIDGATSASYTPSTATVGTTYYYCVVSDDNGSATTNVAAIEVTAPAGDYDFNTPVKYALSEGNTFTSGQTVQVKDGSVVVATITYGETGGNDFSAAQSESSVSGYTAFTAGNGTNGNKPGGTWYTIVPKYNSIISVAVVLNKDKEFYIMEDGTALSAYKGIKVSDKYNGTYQFVAKANSSYKVYCSGSKLGFYGFTIYPYTPVSISDAQYATFSYDKALDFTGTGVEAYIVTSKSGDDAVKLEQVTKVPAETGLLLKAAENVSETKTFNIPVIAASEATSIQTNYLHAHLTVGEPSESDYYILASDNDVVCFYKSKGGSLAANRAYLVMPTSGAPSLSFDFGGGTTGLSEELRVNSKESIYYDLSGRRVAQPTKGLYIVNGKKVLVP